MKVFCAPPWISPTNSFDIRFQMFAPRTVRTEGQVAGSMLDAIKRYGIAPDPLGWDFLSIALGVIAADESCSRNDSTDGWTRDIELTVAVSKPAAWTPHTSKLEAALRFLTTDRWTLKLMDGGLYPAPPAGSTPRPEDCVSLLSGGLDSFVGAVDLKAAGLTPLLVSQVAPGDKSVQRDIARTLMGNYLHLQLNHYARPPAGFSERSQRARSIVFIAYAVLAATSLASYAKTSAIDIYIPENGFISLNIPLTTLRLASHSTRTTHPYYLGLLQELFDAVGLRVRLVNPYQFKTKGEMLTGCSDQGILETYAGETTSCGRFARNAFTHCGRCVPCQIRRAAFHRWGSDPTHGYKYAKLGINDPRHAGFDDVRSMAIAVDTAKKRGLNAWIGSGLSMVPLQDRTHYVGVVQRGIVEIGAFLRQAGVM